MSTGEWVWTEVVDVVEHRDGELPRPTRAMVGMVRMQGGAVVVASTIVGGPAEDAVYVLPPASVAHLLAALRRALLDTS